MKTTLLFLLLMLHVSAFAKVYSTSDGAGDAGGGEPILSAKVSALTISDFIEIEAPSVLLSYLNNEAYLYKNGVSQNYLAQIFDVIQDLHSEIKTWKIEIRNFRPCYDSNGLAKEGSTVISTKTICLSAFLLSNRLDASNYQQQTFALLLHEISHLYGANEVEAQELQTYILASFEKTSPQIIYEDMQKIFPQSSAVANYPQWIEKPLFELENSSLDILQAEDDLDSIQVLLSDFMKIIWRPSASYVNRNLLEIWGPQSVRIHMLKNFYRASNANAVDWMNMCFDSQITATAGDCLSRTLGIKPGTNSEFQKGYSQVHLVRPTNVSETAIDLIAFRKFIEDVKSDAHKTINAKFNVSKH